METKHPAEAMRLEARNLTRAQVVADIDTCRKVLGGWAKLADRMMVSASTLQNAYANRQAFTGAILFGLYSDPPGNEIRVMGPNARYIQRGDVAEGDAESTDDWKPIADAAADAAQVEGEASLEEKVDADLAKGEWEPEPAVETPGEAASADDLERQNVDEARAWIRDGGERKAAELEQIERAAPSFVLDLRAVPASGGFLDPLSIARETLTGQLQRIDQRLAEVQPLIAAKARIEAAIAALGAGHE